MKRFCELLISSALVIACGGCLISSSHHRVEDYTPVFAAAAAGDLDAVKQAIQTDKSLITAREWDDATLLHLAVQQNRKNVTEFLLNSGSDVNASTKDGLTPLHMAAQNGNVDMIKLLLDRKAKINPIDRKNWTPLDRAVKWNHPDAVEFLKQRGATSSTS